MQEYSQILINSLIFVEVLLALCLMFIMHLASKKVLEAQVYIEEHLGELTEVLVQARQQVRLFNKVADFLKALQSYRKIKKIITTAVDIINIVILLTPGTKMMKVRRFLSTGIIKKGLNFLKI